MKSKHIRGEYGTSDAGNFTVVDTIGVPHPFVIGPKHVEIASDRFGGKLGTPAIEEAEKQGVRCYGGERTQDRCQLTYAQHEQALLVECKTEMKDNKELHAYLLSIKDEATKQGYAGFTFVKAGR